MNIETILATIKFQEERVKSLYDVLLPFKYKPGLYVSDKETLAYERAKLIGMLDILDALKIDRSEFNWIFNI